jgi:hypothetical protein
LIIVRNLLAGCRTFGELLEGAPGISRALGPPLRPVQKQVLVVESRQQVSPLHDVTSADGSFARS